MERETSSDLWIKASLILVAAAGPSFGQPATPAAIDCGPDWNVRWNEVRFNSGATRYSMVRENGKPVLKADSDDSASALWLALEESVSEQTKLTWRWKVTRGLTNNLKEREKGGDDYAARVLVAFDPKPFSRGSRALCYVWASEESVGSIYESPYSSNVITIVLESGSRRTGDWVTETRNIREDYRRAFDTQPDTIHAVAVMVDTDDTKSSATAWFSDISLVP